MKNKDNNGITNDFEQAIFWGSVEKVREMIENGEIITEDSLDPLGEMDITDWLIESDEDEKRYAEIAQMLISHGADPEINAFDGKELILQFPEKMYPIMHKVLSEAKKIKVKQIRILK